VDTITATATKTSDPTCRVSLTLGLHCRAAGEQFLRYAPSYICSIDPADDLAKTYRPVNWESGVISGAGFAVRRWFDDQQGLVLVELKGRLASDGIQAIALATSTALATLFAHATDVESNAAWDIQLGPAIKGWNAHSSEPAVAGRAGA